MLYRHRGVFLRVVLAIGLLPLTVSAQTLDVGTWTGSGCCDFGFRGYVFTAPVDFTITGLSVMSDGSVGQLEVVRFDAFPPAFSATTSNFTSLFYSATMTASTSIGVNAGDIIGVYGYDFTRGFTPYSTAHSGYASSIFGNPVALYRSGQQSLGQASDLWYENGPIGAIALEYRASTVPEPATLGLLVLGILGVAAVGRRRRAGG
jgi:hypothetical protein